jgi:hypothetical protein
MRVRVDHGADAVYLNLTDRPIRESEEVAESSWTTTTRAGSSASKSSMRPSARLIPTR